MNEVAALINPVYEYMSSIGVLREKADLFVTTDMKLTNKEGKRGFFEKLFACTSSTYLPAVLTKFRSTLQVIPEQSELYKRTLFICLILQKILSKQDPQLAKLSQVNRLRFFFERATANDREQLQERVQQIVDGYFARDALEECTDIFSRLTLSGASCWQRDLPADLLAYLYKLLPFADFYRAASSCMRWRKIAERESVTSHFFSTHLRPFFSTLDAPIWQNRRLTALYASGSFQEVSLARPFPHKRHFLKFAANPLESVENGKKIVLENQATFLVYSGKTLTVQNNPLFYEDAVQRDQHVVSTNFGVFTFQSTYSQRKTFFTILQLDSEEKNWYNEIFSCNFEIKYISYKNETFYVVGENKQIYVVDWNNKKGHFSRKLDKHNIEYTFLFHYGLFRSASNQIEIEDISSQSGNTLVLPNTQNLFILTATSKILYLSDTKNTVIAYDFQTGLELNRYQHPQRERMAKLEGHVSNGLLYLRLQPNRFYVLDLLTKRHVCNIPLADHDLRVVSNRIIYIPKKETQNFFLSIPIQEIAINK